MTVSAGVLKSAHQADCQHGGSQMPDIQLTVSAGVLKSRHPSDCQCVGSQSRTVHGQSEFDKPSRYYLGSIGAWGSLGCPWDSRAYALDFLMEGHLAKRITVPPKQSCIRYNAGDC
jgi:hypothetical protein